MRELRKSPGIAFWKIYDLRAAIEFIEGVCAATPRGQFVYGDDLIEAKVARDAVIAFLENRARK